MKQYVLLGDPIPLMRPRMTKYGVWDPQRNLKIAARFELELQHNKQPLLQGPLRLEILFVMPIPASWSKKKHSQHVGRHHIVKPDTSNLLKFTEDVATGVIYHDDCIISQINARKIYGLEPRTEFSLCILEELNNEAVNQQTVNDQKNNYL